MTELTGIGYWVDHEVLNYNAESRRDHASEIELPDPKHLLAAVGPSPVDPRVLAYLRSGSELMALLGYSYCRFRCGIDDSEMGCRDLTDGAWVWPEGLVHYVEVHQVPLPADFIATMERNLWSVPTALDLPRLAEKGVSLTAWKTWSETQVTGPSNR